MNPKPLRSATLGAAVLVLGAALATLAPSASADPVGDLTNFVACAPDVIHQLAQLTQHVADQVLYTLQSVKCSLSPRCYAPTLVPLNVVCFTLGGSVGCGAYVGIAQAATGCSYQWATVAWAGILTNGCKAQVYTYVNVPALNCIR